MFYRVLADALTVVHLGFMAYAVFGQLLILVGIAFRWRWIRNPWFRWTHMSAIVLVAIEAVLGIRCPLTDWEDSLRALAGETGDGRSFTARLVHAVLFLDRYGIDDLLHYCYLGFAIVVLATFVLVPPGTRSPKGSVVVKLGCAEGQPGRKPGYVVSEVKVERPRAGACTHTVVCPVCARSVGIRVRSTAHFLGKAVLLALVGVAVAAVGLMWASAASVQDGVRTPLQNMVTDIGLILILLAPSGILVRRALLDAGSPEPASPGGRHRVVL